MSTSKNSLQNRLARVEGQIRGLVRMVEQDRQPAEILTQVAALRSALDAIGSLVVSDQLETLADSNGISSEKLESIKFAIELFLK